MKLLEQYFYPILRSNKNCIFFFHTVPCQAFPLTKDTLCSRIKPKNEVLEKKTDKSWTIQVYWTFKNNLSIFLKNKLFAIKPKLHSFRPKKELPHTRKYKWVFKTKLSEHMYRKKKIPAHFSPFSSTQSNCYKRHDLTAWQKNKYWLLTLNKYTTV